MKPCVMCSRLSSAALDPADHRRSGERVPLCEACFADERALLHAMAFARAMWR